MSEQDRGRDQFATREYEALVILKAAGTEQDLAKQIAQLEEQVKKAGGRLERSQQMGRRRLAFRIARQTEGHYHLLRFHAPTHQVEGLDRLFRLNQTVVRFLLLSEDELAPGPRTPVPVRSA